MFESKFLKLKKSLFIKGKSNKLSVSNMTSIFGRIKLKIEVSIALLLWCYIIYKAVCIPITQDEVHSYLLVKTNNWRQMVGTANTHWLNSLFMKLFLWLPGIDQPWKLRMLSIFTWCAYSFSSIKLSHQFKSPFLGFCFFIVAVCNPFLIMYFSLARGYAAACAFIMLTMWQAAKLISFEDYKPYKWVLAFLFAAFAVIANFSAFYFFIALTAVYLLKLLQMKDLKAVFCKSALIFILLIMGTAVFAVSSLLIMRRFNTLYFGGESNVVDSIFGSTVKSFSYFDNPTTQYLSKGVGYLLSKDLSLAEHWFGWIIFLLISLATAYSFYTFKRRSRFTLSTLAFFVIFFIVIMNIFFHFLFGTPYLLERTVLILYPPLVVGLFIIISDVNKVRINRSGLNGVLFLIGFLHVLFVYNFYKSFSILTFKEWPVQTDTKKGLDYLKASNAKKVGMNVWQRDVLINYYLLAYPNQYQFEHETVPELSESTYSGIGDCLNCDFLFLNPPFDTSLLSNDWKLELYFPTSGSKIFKKETNN